MDNVVELKFPQGTPSQNEKKNFDGFIQCLAVIIEKYGNRVLEELKDVA